MPKLIQLDEKSPFVNPPPRKARLVNVEPKKKKEPSFGEKLKSSLEPVLPTLLGGPGLQQIYDVGESIYKSPKEGGADLIPLAGGLVGSRFGGPVGMSVGTLLGGILKDSVKSGKMPTDSQIAGNVAQSGAEVGLSSLLALPNKRATIAKWLFDSKNSKARAEALNSVPFAPVSVSEVTGSTPAKLIEDIAAPVKSRAMTPIQQTAINHEFNLMTPGTSEIRAGKVKGEIDAGFQKLIDRINSAATSLKSLAGANPLRYQREMGPPKITTNPMTGQKNVITNEKTVDIMGPIEPRKSFEAAENMLAEWRKTFSAKDNIDLESIVPPEQKRFVRLLTEIVSTRDYKDPSKLHPIGFDTAREVKMAAGERGGFGNDFRGFDEKKWADLNKSMNEDLKAGIATWKNGGAGAAKFYEKLNKETSTKYELYNKHQSPAVAGLKNATESGTSELRTILRDPVSIDKTIRASRNPAATRKDLQAEWIADVQERSFHVNPQTQQPEYSASKPLSELLGGENKPVVERLFKDPIDRKNVENFFKSVAILDPNHVASGATAAGIRMAYNGSVILGAIGSQLLFGQGRDITPAATIVAAGIGLNQFAKHVLLNKQVAQLIPMLAKMPSNTPQSNAIREILFTAMKGTEISLMNAKGEEVGKGMVGEKGKILPIPASSPPTDQPQP